MTSTNDDPYLPSAYDVLAEAYNLVSRSSSTILMIDRAKVLLGIAREIREGSQGRHAAMPAAAEAPPAEPETKPVAIAVDPTIAQLANEHPTMIHEWSRGIVARALDQGQRMEDDPADTQRIVAPWAVGDKTECRHCGTLIELGVGESIQGLQGLKAWRHKYTQQVVCATPILAQQVAEDSVSARTFAEPAPRG